MTTPQTQTRQLCCSRCGTEFSCNLSGSCWCAAEPYRLPVPADANSDCLCPNCLRELAGQRTDTPAT